jgi:hypothetical protein
LNFANKEAAVKISNVSFLVSVIVTFFAYCYILNLKQTLYALQPVG